MPTLIQLRRGTTAEWESVNPVLGVGEPGIEFPAAGGPLLKIGDGTSDWLTLAYAVGAGEGGDGGFAEQLVSTLPDEGSYLVAYSNPEGTKLGGAVTVGAALDDLNTNTVRKGSGTPVPLVDSVAANDRIVIELAAGGFRTAPAATALANGTGATITENYSLLATDRRVVAKAAAAITVPKQVDQAFAALTSIEILKTGSFVVTLEAVAGVQLNGVDGNSIALDTAFSIVRLVRDPIAPNVWYVSGDVTAAADTDPPEPVSFLPVDGATNVSTGTALEMELNEVCAFGASGSITISENDGGWSVVETFDVATDIGSAAGQVELIEGGTKLVIHPTAALPGGTPIAIDWTAGTIEDEAGNPIAANTDHTLWNFTTVTPVVTEATPVIYTGGKVGKGTGTFDIPVPAGIQEGDWAMLWLASSINLDPDLADLDGYWSLGVNQSTRTDPAVYCVERTNVDLATLPTHVTVGRAYASDTAYVWIVLRNAEFDALVGKRGTTGMPNPDPLAQVAALTGRLIFGFLEDDDSDDIEPPSPYQRLWRQNCGLYDGTGTTICVGWRAPQGSASDSHDPGVFTGTGNDAWSAIHMSVKTKA